MVPNDPSVQYPEKYIQSPFYSVYIFPSLFKNSPIYRHHTVVDFIGQRGVTQGGTPYITICNVVVEAVPIQRGIQNQYDGRGPNLTVETLPEGLLP